MSTKKICYRNPATKRLVSEKRAVEEGFATEENKVEIEIPDTQEQPVEELPTDDGKNGIIANIHQYIGGMFSGPVMSNLVSVNKDAAVLAARNRFGKLINDKIRAILIARIVPDSMKHYLEIPFVQGLIDLAVANIFTGLVVMFGSKLPGGWAKYGNILCRCSATAAYSTTFGAWNVEEFLEQFMTSDMKELLTSALAEGA